MSISYKKGYKFQIVKDFECEVEVFPNQPIKTDYLVLTTTGTLYIQKGYAYDGPSGPTFDTKNFMQASLVHDALYQLIRMELLDKKWRAQADRELLRICKEQGMSWWRAKYVYEAVRLGGASAADPENKKKVIVT